MVYNQVVVVEGKHDEQKLVSIFPKLECIVTNGSSISKETLNLIYETSLKKEVILFLDPDFPGKKITDAILKTNGSFKIAFINKEKAKSKNGKKVGIEHANREDIVQSLENLFTVKTVSENVTVNDLMTRGLVNSIDSKKKRFVLCKTLNIPISNGKALLKYLNILDIRLERIDDIFE
ncbi:MAG: ribonuclease M5 [Tenericutes bacterium]|nr:ribonuclease M5 [Mycoplasmatota bacterium]